MRSNSVKALILLGLFSLTTGAQSLFAATRVRPKAQSSRTAHVRKSVAQKNKKATTTRKRTTRRKTTSKPARKRQTPTEAAVRIQGAENVFAGLDRDKSGFISRSEWPGERKSFDALDRNDDGRLSLAELRSREL